jgi:superfamily I DNA/RNA helicase
MAVDLSVLNPPQREAVLHGDGPLLVLAGAGSGKTRVLTFRVAHLLERGWPARAICALSFTNKAADEMEERLARLVGTRDVANLTLSTFHSLGLMILKKEQEAFGFPRGFTIYDTADQLGVIREILRDVRIDDRKFDVKAILHRISRAKNAAQTPEEYAEAHDPDDDYDAITTLVFPRYQKAMRGFAAVDFDDLILETVRLLERDEGARERWAKRYRHILVDEYQDTNKVQLALIRVLAADHSNVTVVGDDDQSIYGWRGAEASNILQFESFFPNGKMIKLEQNYRSTPTILRAANAVIANNSTRHKKELWSDKDAGARVVVGVTLDADAEAKFVCDEIERLRLESRRRYLDCAVLYRSNIQARALEEAFHSRRIPFEMHGGQQFYERKEIKDVIAYLKLVLNPRDDISLRRIINYPARGIGHTTQDRLIAWAQGRKIPLWEACLRVEEVSTVTGAARNAVKELVTLVEKTRVGLGSGCTSTATQLVEDICLYDDLRAASGSLPAAARRVDNVREFLKSLQRREDKSPGVDSLRDYLNYLSLKPNDDDDSEGDGDQVTMTTLHGAKGLEWPVVFLVGVEEELLPHARTLYPQGPDVEGEVDVSEERRLAYVGITRARECLYITRALYRHKHGRDHARTPSRFLMEIPTELVEVRDMMAEARKPVQKAELQNFFKGWSPPK